jgi:hypothetical protein
MIRFALPAFLLLGSPAGVVAQAPPAAATAESLALKVLDTEAVYTVAGGLKPASDGFWETRFPADRDTTPEIDRVRELLAELVRGTDLTAGVTVYAKPFDGKKAAAAFVAHRPSLKALIERRMDVFAPIGVTPDTDPQQVFERIDRADTAARWRAFGLVFGYPEHAVEFFVAAGLEGKRTGKLVERDFVHLPTVAADEGRFVYAVPKGHAANDADRTLRAAAEAIHAEYVRRRAVYVGHGKAGAVALLRDWATPPPAVAPPATCPPIVAPPNCIAVPPPTCRRRPLLFRKLGWCRRSAAGTDG